MHIVIGFLICSSLLKGAIGIPLHPDDSDTLNQFYDHQTPSIVDFINLLNTDDKSHRINRRSIPSIHLKRSEDSYEQLNHQPNGIIISDDLDKYSDIYKTPLSQVDSEAFKLPLVQFISDLINTNTPTVQFQHKPRMGRDIDCIEAPRSRPPFAPRLGKKSYFKPRFERDLCSNFIEKHH